MTLVALRPAPNCTTLPASWRHRAARIDVTSPDAYRHVGQVREAGQDDHLAMRNLYTGHHAPTVTNGIRNIKLDPVVVLTTMGLATTHLS